MGLSAAVTSHDEAKATYKRMVAMLDQETPD